MTRRTKPIRPKINVSPRKPNATALAVVRERARDNNPIWEALTKLAAPAAVMVSATCYLSGYSYKYVLLHNFGFRPGLIDSSVQDNIAFGYLPFAFLVLAFLGALVGLWLAQEIARIAGKYRSEELTWSIRIRMRHPLSSLNLAQFTGVLLSAGIIAGGSTAEWATYRIDTALSSRCLSNCYHYRLSIGQMTGVMVAQSKDVTILAGRTDTYVVPTSSVKSSRPVRDRAFGWLEL
jgi:hypothetical protein